MKEITITRQEMLDQVHINSAYAHIKDALVELASVKEIDGQLHRLLRDMYKYEDALYDYVASPKILN